MVEKVLDINAMQERSPQSMNSQIINNLFEFWKLIGKLNNKLVETENYSAVSIDDSDWPNRIFDLQKDNEIIEEIKVLSKNNELPELVALAKSKNMNDSDFDFVFRQRNMALDLGFVSKHARRNSKIKRVKTETDSKDFAKTASESFGYLVDYRVLFKILKSTDRIRLYTYHEEMECLGCGIVFFDSKNIAGLHMIGTLPKGRGKGVGKSMTEYLLKEAKTNNMKTCVLHASLMGEPIYTKLGFKAYGEIETYRILK